MTERARLIFTGVLQPGAFVEFARHRASRLALGLEIGDVSSVRISLTVSGETDLIDAFEMACSLGPYDCMVRDVARRTDELAA